MFSVIQKFSLRDGMNQFSFTLKLPHVLLLKSADKCLMGPFDSGRGEENWQ